MTTELVGRAKGGAARAASLSPERRREIARQGGLARKAALSGQTPHARQKIVAFTSTRPKVDVQAIRSLTGLSQAAFADTFHINVATLRNWEQGKREPDGPARVLLLLIEHNYLLIMYEMAVLLRNGKL